MEAGEAVPTIAQLRKAAEVYNRGRWLCSSSPSRPRGSTSLRDFRRLDGTRRSTGRWQWRDHTGRVRRWCHCNYVIMLAWQHAGSLGCGHDNIGS